MYRARDNYIRLGTSHIFINLNEENLKDIEAINEAYGHGVRTKNAKRNACLNHELVKAPTTVTVWSGNIHIFIDRLDIDDQPTTYYLLRTIKMKYGDIFRINVHWYTERIAEQILACHPDMEPAEWFRFHKVNMWGIYDCPGMINVITHKHVLPVTFTAGSIKFVVRLGELGLEVSSVLIENRTRSKSSCMHYDSYRLKSYYNDKR